MKFRRAKELKAGDKITLFSGKEVVIIKVDKGWCPRSVSIDYKFKEIEPIKIGWLNVSKESLVQLTEDA